MPPCWLWILALVWLSLALLCALIISVDVLAGPSPADGYHERGLADYRPLYGSVRPAGL